MIVNIILICGKCRGKQKYKGYNNCLLYTSDAADEL